MAVSAHFGGLSDMRSATQLSVIFPATSLAPAWVHLPADSGEDMREPSVPATEPIISDGTADQAMTKASDYMTALNTSNINAAAPRDKFEMLDRIYEALSQAQDCVRGETPEDIPDEEARADTISKIREAMELVEALTAQDAGT
jgi:hypothetical protein